MKMARIKPVTQRAAEHTDHAAAAEHKADDDGDDGQQCRRHHFLQARAEQRSTSGHSRDRHVPRRCC